MLTVIEGRCHCGNLAWEFGTPQPRAALPIRECQCRFCRMHGAATARDPEGWVNLRARDDGAILRYRFASRTTDFIICARCGCYVGAVLVDGDKRYATLNMRLSDLDLTGAQPVVYDDEPVQQRVARRIELFTPMIECPF